MDGNLNRSTININDHPDAYHERYQQNFNCGEADVNDRPLSAYSTDIYWGMYYMTPERLKVNTFTIPFAPPDQSTLGMMGTATHIHSIPGLAASNPHKYAVCAFEGTAYKTQLEQTFPQLNVQGVPFSGDMYQAFNDGTCDILIDAYPFLKKYVKRLYDKGQCKTKEEEKPIGVIGDPLEYGLNYFSFGISQRFARQCLVHSELLVAGINGLLPTGPQWILL